MDLLIKGGKVVGAKTTFKADVAVKNDKIVAIGNGLKAEKDTEVVDARGKLVLPGAIDGHTHLAMPFGGTISTDDYYAGTRSAACGGTTTVFDFILQGQGEPMLDSIKRRDALAAPDAAVDYSFHIGVTDVTTDKMLDSMEDAVKFGIPSFKVFMVYDFGVDDGSFYKVLQKAKKIGALVGVHAENRDVNNVLVKQYLAEGKVEPWWHYMSKNEDVEGEADVRAINLAKMAGTSLYIVHLADKQG
ncbi:MAG TPA: amidohydrolase family protein, partial [Bacillota bacterium]|nr:amidohydrolase family protein [Bacillota bacterium]